jgi:hypothetical protein
MSGDIIQFEKRRRIHDRAPVGSRAANSASISSVTSESPRIAAAATTFDHRSAGIESRAFIVRAWESGMPIASPNLAGPPKASMTEANESIPESLHQVASRVNTARSDSGATVCSMVDRTKKRQGDRLEEARKQAGFKSARAAAIECGWAESTYRAHERGTRTIGRDDADKYARRFEASGSTITSRSILYPDGETPTESDDYQRGWRDAVEHMSRAGRAAIMPKKRGA